MVDWEVVDRRRAKGWDWDRIAADPKVGFHADESAGEPGRALRTLYYQRRSKGRRRTDEEGTVSGRGGGAAEVRVTSPLARVGILLTPALGIWFALALAYPSNIGTIGASTVSAVPYIGLALALAAFLLAFGLLRSIERWNPILRSSLVVGVILGFIISGAVYGVSVVAGCPTLVAASISEPGDGAWVKAPNSPWTVNGQPTFYFYGAVGCPYCSASSWVIWYALQQFGTWGGISFSHSSSNDYAPNTASVDLSSAIIQSRWVTLVANEDPDTTVTHGPAVGCPGSAYISNYDTRSGIPFMVVNGQFIHPGTLVDPMWMRSTPGDATSPPLTAAQIQGQFANTSGAAWDRSAANVHMLEALIVVSDHGQGPPKVLADSQVQALIAQIR